jgi:hypothetical protein
MGTKVYDNYADLITFNRNSKGTALRPIGYGDELVTNGTFDTDLSGWTLSNSPAWVSGRVELSRNGGIDIVRQSFATTIGAVYKVTADVTGTSGKLGIGVSSLDDSIVNAGSLVNTSVDRVFVATSNPTWIYLITEVNGTSSWDNVSVKEVLFDREGDPLTLFLHPEGVPRIEYDADRNLKGLLIEPDGQNYDTTSSTITGWTPINTTKSADQTTAPDGVAASADQVLETVATDTHAITRDYALGAGSYIFSCFVKSIGGRNFQLNTQPLGGGGSGGGIVQFNLSTGTVIGGTGTITEIGDGWYRVSAPAVTAGATGIRVIPYSVDGIATSFTGDVTKGFYMWGMQVETGPIATSYMPTTGSPFTRGKDEASMTNVSGLIGQKEGTLYVEVDWRLATGTLQNLIDVSDGTAFNRLAIRNLDYADALSMFAEADDDTKTNQGVDSSGFSGIQKIAFAYKTDDFELYRNGSSISSNTSGSLSALATITDIDIGQRFDANQQANMWIRAVQIIPRRLSNEQLIELTS